MTRGDLDDTSWKGERWEMQMKTTTTTKMKVERKLIVGLRSNGFQNVQVRQRQAREKTGKKRQAEMKLTLRMQKKSMQRTDGMSMPRKMTIVHPRLETMRMMTKLLELSLSKNLTLEMKQMQMIRAIQIILNCCSKELKLGEV
jgi:hypothetical protein